MEHSSTKNKACVLVILLILNVMGLSIFVFNHFNTQKDRELIDVSYVSGNYAINFELDPGETVRFYLTAEYQSPDLLTIAILTGNEQHNQVYSVLKVEDDDLVDESGYDDTMFNRTEFYFSNPINGTMNVNLSIETPSQGTYWIVIVKNLVNNWSFYYLIGAILYLILLCYFGLLIRSYNKKKPESDKIKTFFHVNNETKYDNYLNISPIFINISWIVVNSILYMDIMNFYGDPGLNYEIIDGFSFSLSGLFLIICLPLYLWAVFKLDKPLTKKLILILPLIFIAILIVFLDFIFFTTVEIYVTPLLEYAIIPVYIVITSILSIGLLFVLIRRNSQ